MSHIKEFGHLRIQLDAIKSATNNFGGENIIGNGGFGKVYKGVVSHYKGESMAAIKRLNRAFGQGNPEFWKEVITLSLYQHQNIVSLLGFCDESNEMILVYRYESNRSLDLYLNNGDLTWIQRLKICIGAASGLAYLHNPSNNHTRVLHRDVKSSNILLDENWNAKISDFGLSKFGPANQRYTFMFSNAVGTFGYCDPLYIELGFLTKESDVYSFGVVLFEVLCGRLCIINKSDMCRPLTRLVRKLYKQNRISKIVFGSIKDEINPNSLKAFTTIAYKCLKRKREERPSMDEVVRRLEDALEYQVNEQNLKLTDIFDSTVYKLEEQSSSIFNIDYFKAKILAGEWDEVEIYLNWFTELDDNNYSMNIFFEIRKHKYFEALDRNENAKAVDILKKDLKIFATFNEEVYKEIAMLITLDNFRENEQLAMYGDVKSARANMCVELIKLIEANPLLREKLEYSPLGEDIYSFFHNSATFESSDDSDFL